MNGSLTPPLYRSVGRVIHVLRRERGLRQAEFAELIGLKQPNLSRIENGRVVPQKSTLRRIAQALNMDLQVLLSEATAREVDAKWRAVLSPKNAGQLFSGRLIPVPVYSAQNLQALRLDPNGRPIGSPDITLQLLPLPGTVFGIRVADSAMEVDLRSSPGPSFKLGELVVFSNTPPVASGDYAFIQTRQRAWFRKVILNLPREQIRMLPLNPRYKERVLPRAKVEIMVKLVRHIEDF